MSPVRNCDTILLKKQRKILWVLSFVFMKAYPEKYPYFGKGMVTYEEDFSIPMGFGM